MSQSRHPPEVVLPQQPCPPRKVQVVAQLADGRRRILQRSTPAATGVPPAGFGNLRGDRDGCAAHPLSQPRIALYELPRHAVDVLRKIVGGVPGAGVSMVGLGHSDHAAQYAWRMPRGHYLAIHWSHPPREWRQTAVERRCVRPWRRERCRREMRRKPSRSERGRPAPPRPGCPHGTTTVPAVPILHT